MGKPPQLIIRAATEADAAGIARVNVASWRAAYRGILYDIILDGLSERALTEEWWREITAPTNPASRLFVAEDSGVILGYLRCGPTEDADAPLRTGEIYGFYTDPEVWGRGVGRVLMDTAVEHLRAEGFTRATLWVAQENERSRAIYEHLGWQAANDGATNPFFGATEIRYERLLS